jgi:Protein of unknown function (DUF3455)
VVSFTRQWIQPDWSASKKREREVNSDCSKKFWGGRTVHSIIHGGLLAAVALAASGIASAQDKKDEITFNLVPNVATPAAITPPAGNSTFLAGHVVGTQGYICLPAGSGVSWTVNTARPQATLFTNIFGDAVQILTHFLSPDANPNEFAPSPLPYGSPTWQSSFDGSKVWGQTLHRITAGSDRAARTLARLPVSCCRQSGRKRGQPAAK